MKANYIVGFVSLSATDNGMKSKLPSMPGRIGCGNIAIMMGLFIFMIAVAGCHSNNVSNNPADNPSSTVPGVIKSIGTEGSAAGQFISPESIALDQEGNFYVVDSFNNRIQKFNYSGIQIASWGSNGDGDGQFLGCRGLAVDSDKNVYITDVLLNRVQKFDSAGNFITKWGIEGTGPGQFSAPFDIAADSANNLYVVDSNNHRVQKFDSSGTFLRMFGTQGSGDGQFDQPSGIAIDRNGNIYVGDGNNNRVQKFDRNMNFIVKWGKMGIGDGEFDVPYGVSADSAGNVYVTDIGNNRIQKFDSSGNFIGKVGRKGSRESEFYEPADIDLDQYGNLYVIDESNNRIQLLLPDIFSITSFAAASKSESAIAAADSKASWMKDLANDTRYMIGSTPLTEIAIPGTHDTGTYAITANSDMADDGNVNGPKYVTDVTDSISSWCHGTKWTPHLLCVAIDDIIRDDINPVGTAIAKSVQAPWSTSQDQSILQQLNGGIRFLDLRVQAYKGGFYVVHSMVSVSVTQVLDDIVTFCNRPASSGEVILVALKNYQMTQALDEQLLSLIKTKLINTQGQSLMIPRTTDLDALTLSSLWNSPGRVIVFYSDSSDDHHRVMKNHSEFWYKNAGDGNDAESLSTLVNFWPKTQSNSDLLKVLPAEREDFLKRQGSSANKYLYVSQFVRTQDGRAIKEGIESGIYDKFTKHMGPVRRYLFKKGWKALGLSTDASGNLLDWGTDTNKDMAKYFAAMKAKAMLNIVMVDHYESAPVDFVEQIISYNKEWFPKR